MNLIVKFWNARHQQHVRVRALICSMLLVLSSCNIPSLRSPEPGPRLPAGFNDVTNSENGAPSSENSAQLGIEEFYHDPMLTNLIQQAMVNNRELKMLNEDVQIAKNEILARQGAYLPFVTFGARTGLDKPSLFTPLGAVEKRLEYFPGKHFPDPLPDFRLGLNVFWHPDFFRALRNARDAAAQRYVATTERRNFFVTRMVADIAENYYGLMALDKRIETLDKTIQLQEQSLEFAKARKAAGRGTELAVQRFQAEVRKNQSEKLIVNQEIVEVGNRINFLVGRFPEPVERMSTGLSDPKADPPVPGANFAIERMSAGFFDVNIHALSVGLPAQLLQNRPDIRQAERELEAAGLDVKVARTHFYPDFNITGGVGYQSFNIKYLFNTPDALIYNVAGDLVAPLINKKAIQAEYLSANARQLQSLYNYQRVILSAFTEVINRVSMVQNYGKSIEIKKQQLEALEASVDSASKLFQNARVEYVEVLLAQRDLLDARVVLIETKRQQLSAIVNAYQALGGGNLLSIPAPKPPAPVEKPQPDLLPFPAPLDISTWIINP